MMIFQRRFSLFSTTIFAFSVAEKNADALTFVGNLNALVDETRTAYKRRSKGETESEETPEGGNEGTPRRVVVFIKFVII